jgi:hypothetical protein
MFGQVLQIAAELNLTTAHACACDRRKIDLAKKTIQYVIEELDAQGSTD